MLRNPVVRACLALAVFVMLAACGGTNSSNSPSLVGTWRSATMMTQNPNGGPVNCPGSLPIGAGSVSCGADDRITFNANGTWSQNAGGGTGTWTLTGSTLTMSQAGSPDQSFTVAISETTLTIVSAVGSTTVTLTATRL